MPSTFPERKSDWNSPTAPTQSIYKMRSADWNGFIDHVTGWVNVKSYGAVGDGVTDDGAALLAAKAEAARAAVNSVDWGQGEGGKVYLPRGVYRSTVPITWSDDGVIFEGENKATTAIVFDLANAATDGMTIGDGGGGGRRSGVRNLSIYAASAMANVLTIDSAAWPIVEQVTIFGGNTQAAPYASGYGFRLRGTLKAEINELRVVTCTRGVSVEGSSGGVEPTTAHFKGLYSGSNKNEGVVVARGRQIVFDMPTVELNGLFADPANGTGMKIGVTDSEPVNVTINGPYFEGNAGWDVDVGGAQVTYPVHAAIVNPFSTWTGGTKASGYGGVIVRKAISGGVLGGDFSSGADATHPAVSIASGVFNFDVLGVAIPAASPVLYNGGSVAAYDGLVATYNGSGQQELQGRLRILNLNYLASLASSGDVIKLATGGRLHIGDGTNDYLVSESGVGVTTPAYITASGTRIGASAGFITPTSAGSMLVKGNENNGSGAIGVKIYNGNALSTSGARALGVYSDGSSTEAASVQTNGTTFGIRLKSPDGTWYLLTIANGGTVNIAAAP
jgi:hypothetical protein